MVRGGSLDQPIELERWRSMTQQPRSVSIAFVFMLLDALIWLTFGLIVALGAHPALPDVPLVRWSMAVLSLAVARMSEGSWSDR